MRKKLFLALIALTACCGYGCAEDEGGATCTDGERRCYGEHSQVCKDGAYTTEKCTMGCDAVSGKCNTSPATPEICDDGKFQCADGKLEKCVSNAWVKQEECPADRCDATAGKCNPAADKVCDDGKFQCADGKLEKCVSNAWVKQEECPADRCDATAGKCNTDNPPADKCTNDTFKCENEKLYKCENESWNAGTACPAAKCNAETGVCNEEQPPADKCETGKFKCENDKLYKCENESWNAGTACPAAKCNAETGVCNEEQPPADKCETGKFKCENDKLFKCENESWDAGTACPAAKCNADTGMCDEEQPPADKCETGKFKCENDKLFKCENESWNAGTACPAATHTCDASAADEASACVEKSTEPPAETCTQDTYKCGTDDKMYKCVNNQWTHHMDCPVTRCEATTGTCKPDETPLEKCTATSTKKCEATCNADKKGGYYWGGSEIVTITGCNNSNPCTVSSDNGYVACKDKLLTRCTATSSAKCHVSCDPDGSKGYYWDRGLKTVSCTGSNKCVINANLKVSCESDTKESCATLEANKKDKYTCENDKSVKFCNSKTDTYWNIDCDGCSVSALGKHYYCNTTKKACTAESKASCYPNCISENEYYQWQGGDNPQVILTTCKGKNPYCQEMATNAKCAANP